MQQHDVAQAGGAARALGGSAIGNNHIQLGCGHAGGGENAAIQAVVGGAGDRARAQEMNLGTFNCRGYGTATLSMILEFFSAGKPAVLALQDLGGNSSCPAAARLAADTDLLAAAGVTAWHNQCTDNSVALLYSTSLQNNIYEKPCDNTHIASLQLEIAGQHTQITTTYWRPSSSASSAKVSTAALELASSGPGKQIILGDLNCCAACIDGRVVSQRNDTRSRAVARWLRDAHLAPCYSSDTYRSGPHSTKIDYIILPSAQIQHAETQWMQHSDHALLTCSWALPQAAAANPIQQANAAVSFRLPAYGAYEWHTYGEKLAANLRALADDLPTEDQSDAPLQALADKLHNAITSAAKLCLQSKTYAAAVCGLPPTLRSISAAGGWSAAHASARACMI